MRAPILFRAQCVGNESNFVVLFESSSCLRRHNSADVFELSDVDAPCIYKNSLCTTIRLYPLKFLFTRTFLQMRSQADKSLFFQQLRLTIYKVGTKMKTFLQRKIEKQINKFCIEPRLVELFFYLHHVIFICTKTRTVETENEFKIRLELYGSHKYLPG